jgi:hypothetical protein
LPRLAHVLAAALAASAILAMVALVMLAAFGPQLLP